MATKPYSNPSSLLLILTVLFHLITTTHQHQITTVDLLALCEIKTALIGPLFFSSWNLASPDPCSTFSGLTCFSNRVDSLQLGPNLSGSLSLLSLPSLSELTQFVLSPGFITGPIPPQLGSLTNLRVISLAKNNLIGPIPKNIFSLPHLHTLDLSYNSLTGSIPPVLASLNRLKIVDFASNLFSGPIPKTLPPQILHADLKNNRFSGHLPNRMPLSIRYFSVSNNDLFGPIDAMVNLYNLVYLDLSMNRFNGSIPGLLFRPTLSSVLLQRNNFSGSLPLELPSPSLFSPLSFYGPGSIVDLSHNAMTGDLSPVLANVETVFVNNNRFTGTVPVEYLDAVISGRTRNLYMQHNFLSGIIGGEKIKAGWPESATVCVSYNCMVPPEEMVACPVSAGGQLSRPMDQCLGFNNGSYIIG